MTLSNQFTYSHIQSSLVVVQGSSIFPGGGNNITFIYSGVITSATTILLIYNNEVITRRHRRDISNAHAYSTFQKTAVCVIVSQEGSKVTCQTPKSNHEASYIQVSDTATGATEAISIAASFSIKVTDFQPRFGSLLGGTEVEITGEGFGDIVADVVVMFGASPCTVKEVGENKILCTTTGSGRLHKIDNSGISPGMCSCSITYHELIVRFVRSNLFLNNLCILIVRKLNLSFCLKFQYVGKVTKWTLLINISSLKFRL